MSSPVTGEFNLVLFDPHLPITDLKPLNSAEDNFTSAQLAETSSSLPHVPNASSMSKRRRRKPRRLEGCETDVQKEHRPPKISSALSDPSSPCLSLQREKSRTKGVKTPVPSSPAMIRAMGFQRSVGTGFPSCIRIMCSSQVNSGFWLGLPFQFCKSYLPKEDATFVLEDENGVQCGVKYIAYKCGLSAGWKSFALQHKLIEEDVLIFQLVETSKFKVHILKADDSSKAHTKQTSPVTPSPKTKKKKPPGSLSSTASRKKHKKSVPSSRSVPPGCHCSEHSGNNSEQGGPEALECSRPSKPYLFQDVKSFQDFHIMVNDLCIDSELPYDVRIGYYKLCVYKKEFLHDSVPECLYCKLVSGMIGETVRIVNEIKGCKITTTKEDFDKWDNSLKSFELLGMKVGFLRDKIHTLATLVFESEGSVDIKRYVEARNDHKRAEDEINKVAAKLKVLKATAKRTDRIAGCLKQKVEKYENKFKEEVEGL